MHIKFSSSLNPAYFKAIFIMKRERSEVWDIFKQAVPAFSAVPSYHLASIITHLQYQWSIRKSIHNYSSYWKKDAGIIIQRLNKVFGYSSPVKKITAHVCVTPLYIRNIEKRFFLLPTNADRKRIMNILIHEISHFYCYHGYKLFGREMEDEWELSEYIVPYLLNKYFADLCGTVEESYIGKAPEKYDGCIKGWLNQEYSFIEMLDRIYKESQEV